MNVILPLTLLIIFLLLYFHFRSVTEVLIVMAGLCFAVVGGVWLLFVLGYNISVAVMVGFIALAGLAAETGVVMITYLDEAYERWKREGKIKTTEDLHHAIIAGSAERVRPVLMTVSTTLIGLLPIMFGSATGAQVMKRIAAPLFGGLVSALALTLLVLPAVYEIWKRRELGSSHTPSIS